MAPYRVKEIFHTLQGEGAQSGRAAVFLRFAGCNLSCEWCDTDFAGGDVYATTQDLVDAVARTWQGSFYERYVVLTGGEPALQVTPHLVLALHAAGFTIAIETNGTKPLPEGIDWVTVSPKKGSPLVVTKGNELKLVHPQMDPAQFVYLDFQHFFLQPMDGPDVRANTDAAMAYCLRIPPWRLSLQIHKILGIR